MFIITARPPNRQPTHQRIVVLKYERDSIQQTLVNKFCKITWANLKQNDKKSCKFLKQHQEFLAAGMAWIEYVTWPWYCNLTLILALLNPILNPTYFEQGGGVNLSSVGLNAVESQK